VIRNAARLTDCSTPSTERRDQLADLFGDPGDRIVVGAGRLSPEKGVHVLIAAAKRVIDADPVRGSLYSAKARCGRRCSDRSTRPT